MTSQRDESASQGSAPLAGRLVVVTGASSGIGRGIALAAAGAGADVAITYRGNEAGARDTLREVERMGRRGQSFALDLGDGDRVAALPREVRDACGPVYAWINNAGADILTGSGARLSPLEKLDMLLRVDLRGTMLASWAVAELMKAQPDGGVIVNMSWDHVVAGMEGRNPEMFAAVKGGVMSFSKSLARSVAPRVRVNILAPGWIDTAFGEGLDDERRRAVAESTPMKRWGTPDDVANAALFLISPASEFITGQTVNVGGGVIM